MAITLRSTGLNARALLGSVSQGATSHALDVPKWGADFETGGTLTVTLNVDNGTPGRNTAPHAVVVEAMVTGFKDESLTTADWDASMHRVEYVHDSGDIHAGEFIYGERLFNKNRRIWHGKRSVHVYREPGRYVHSVFVVDQAGNWGTASVDIEVALPVYDPGRVIVLAPDGDFENAPYCLKKNRVTTLLSVQALAPTLTGDRPKVLYIKRGHQYTVGEAENRVPVGGFDVVPWGRGAAPVFSCTPGGETVFSVTGNGYFKIRGMSVEGLWDPVGEMYPTGQLADYIEGGAWYTGGLVGVSASYLNVVVDQCKSRNASTNLLSLNSLTGGFAVMHECDHQVYKEFAIFGSVPDGTLAFIGNKIHQHPAASSGGLPRWFFNPENASGAGWYPNNAHNGLRTETSHWILVYGNDLFARHGWTTQPFDVYVTNAPLRLNTNGAEGTYASVTNNWIEAQVHSGAVGGVGMPSVNYVWEMNGLIRDVTINEVIAGSGMGHTFRNNMVYIPNVATANADLINIFKAGHDARNPAVGRNEVYSNTTVDLLSASKHGSPFVKYDLSGANPLVENNVYYAPNLDTPEMSDGPLDLSLLPWVPLYAGQRKSYEYWPSHYTLPSAVAPNASFTMPYRADRNGTMTNAASFAGTFGKSKITITGVADDYLSEPTRAIEIAYESGGIKITNKTAGTWPAGGVVTAWLHRGTTLMAMDTRTATPADSLKRGWTTPSSGAYEAATTGLTSLHDVRGRPRRGTAHPKAAAGTPSRGATEPA